jgi:branched-chain amino acid aminotransferase
MEGLRQPILPVKIRKRARNWRQADPMGQCIYLNGRYLDSLDQAMVPLHEHAFLYGDGIFEGIRAYHGRIFRMKDHMDRLWRSARSIMLEIPESRERLDRILLETVKRTGLTDAYIRLVVSRGTGDMGIDPRKCEKGAIYIIAGGIQLYPEEKYRKGLRTIICATRRTSPDSLNPQVKTLNYLNNIMGKIEAIQAGVDEGIMLNACGHVTEGTADNLFIVRDGRLYTPPTHVGILEGITRRVIFEICSEREIVCVEKVLAPHDLYSCDEAFLCGTGAELIPVVEVGGRPVGDSKPGPIFQRLLGLFRERTQVDGTPFR